jgi:hypothetical protein
MPETPKRGLVTRITSIDRTCSCGSLVASYREDGLGFFYRGVRLPGSEDREWLRCGKCSDVVVDPTSAMEPFIQLHFAWAALVDAVLVELGKARRRFSEAVERRLR